MTRKSQVDKLFAEGDALYEEMLASTGSATSDLHIESYIFASDGIGWKFAEALAERAAAASRRSCIWAPPVFIRGVLNVG